MYHVMNRGDRREVIFRDDADRERFMSALEEASGKTAWQVHAYCLMSNRFGRQETQDSAPEYHEPAETRPTNIF